MPILQSEIKFYLTGGASNSDPNASLGGVISSVEIVDGALHNLFDRVSGDESSAGDIEYRCIGVKNTNAAITWTAVRAYITQNTPAGDDISIGVETPSGGAVQTIANESTAPSGISFSAPSTRSTGLACTGEGNNSGEVGPGKWFAVWVRRNVPAGTPAYNNNYAIIEVSGDTSA